MNTIPPEQLAAIRKRIHRIFSGKTAGVTCTKADLHCRTLLTAYDEQAREIERLRKQVAWLERFRPKQPEPIPVKDLPDFDGV